MDIKHKSIYRRQRGFSHKRKRTRLEGIQFPLSELVRLTARQLWQPLSLPRSFAETRHPTVCLLVNFTEAFPLSSTRPIHPDHLVGGCRDRNRRRFAQVAAGAVQDIEPGGEIRPR